jgi:glycosyltransferase involved in cell wall biosynthesis
MTLLGLRALLAAYPGPVHFISSTANEKLTDQLFEIAAKHPQLSLEKVDYHSSRLEALRNRLKPSRIKKLAERFKTLRPDLILAVQGNIEHSSLALHAALAAGIPSCSYIPVPHSNAQMGAKLGALRDQFCDHLFRLPDSFITITDEMANLLRARGATAPIHLVYNGVDTKRFQPGDREAARKELGLPTDKTLIGVIGRIEFRQKQQHLLVKAVSSDESLISSCHLVFAGDGPDSDNLRSMIQNAGVSATVLPWCDPALLYRAVNAVVIPSRYEGLPLVMLEALASGVTVLGSDRDGMKDLLPPSCRFQPNDGAALGDRIARFVAEACPAPEESLVNRVRETMSLDSFGSSFRSVVMGLAANQTPVSHLQSPP